MTDLERHLAATTTHWHGGLACWLALFHRRKKLRSRLLSPQSPVCPPKKTQLFPRKHQVFFRISLEILVLDHHFCISPYEVGRWSTTSHSTAHQEVWNSTERKTADFLVFTLWDFIFLNAFFFFSWCFVTYFAVLFNFHHYSSSPYSDCHGKRWQEHYSQIPEANCPGWLRSNMLNHRDLFALRICSIYLPVVVGNWSVYFRAGIGRRMHLGGFESHCKSPGPAFASWLPPAADFVTHWMCGGFGVRYEADLPLQKFLINGRIILRVLCTCCGTSLGRLIDWSVGRLVGLQNIAAFSLLLGLTLLWLEDNPEFLKGWISPGGLSKFLTVVTGNDLLLR